MKVAGWDLTGWQVFPLPLDDLSRLAFHKGGTPRGPRFWHGRFTTSGKGGTFLDMRGWGKGNAWVNGHHLGRYWKIGPQRTLYVPREWLRAGGNDIVVLQMEEGGNHSIEGLGDAVYDEPTAPSRPVAAD